MSQNQCGTVNSNLQHNEYISMATMHKFDKMLALYNIDEQSHITRNTFYKWFLTIHKQQTLKKQPKDHLLKSSDKRIIGQIICCVNWLAQEVASDSVVCTVDEWMPASKLRHHHLDCIFDFWGNL